MNSKIQDRGRGMFLGLAVGDALGTTLEFEDRKYNTKNYHREITGGGPFDLDPGQWTDDTAMAVGMAHALIQEKKFDGLDILKEWNAWYKTGKHSCTGTCFDIGNSCRCALQYPFDISDTSKGNGSLMRLAPIVLFSRNISESMLLSRLQSNLTHAKIVGDTASTFGSLLWVAMQTGDVPTLNLFKTREQIKSSGYYLDTFEAALWAVETTNSFENAVIEAVNLGGDADSVGAVAGQLAGAIYGYSSIPERWLNVLAWKNKLLKMADSLLTIHDEKENASGQG